MRRNYHELRTAWLEDDESLTECERERFSSAMRVLAKGWINTDGYSDRERQMFNCGLAYAGIIRDIMDNIHIDQGISVENESRIRMACGQLGVPVIMTPIDDEWTNCVIPRWPYGESPGQEDMDT